MLISDGKVYRNLQEQVLENAKNINDYLIGQNVLNEFGIKVIGEVASVDDIPAVDDYKEDNPDWEYGDAYAVGTEAPYTLYILTRANDENPDDYWFNIGQFPLAGPEGPEGEAGNNIFRVIIDVGSPTMASFLFSVIDVPAGMEVKAGDLLIGRYTSGGGGAYTVKVTSVDSTYAYVTNPYGLVTGGLQYQAGTGISISGATISVDTTAIQAKISAGSGLKFNGPTFPNTLSVDYDMVMAKADVQVFPLVSPSFEADSTYANYGYKGVCSLLDVTSNDIAEVVFSVEQVDSGVYAPVCDTFNGGVNIYASDNTAMTIPNIIVIKR